MVRLAIAAGCLHADLGRDVPLGESGLEGGRWAAPGPAAHPGSSKSRISERTVDGPNVS